MARLAVINDPQGASFIASQFVPENTDLTALLASAHRRAARTACNGSEGIQATRTAPCQDRKHGPNVASLGWAHEVSAGGAGFMRILPGNAE